MIKTVVLRPEKTSVVSQRFSEERDLKHWSLGGSPKKA
jgi:hypothetical protein